MEQLWELKIDWDDPVPEDVYDTWLQRQKELHLLSPTIPCCYIDKESQVSSTEIH